jgi:hypothetical protein
MGSESTCCRFIQDSSPKVLYPCWTVVPTDHEWNSSPSPPTCSHSPGTQQHVYSHLCSWLPHPLDTLPSPEKYRAAKNFCNANQTITVVHIPASPAVSAALFDHSYRWQRCTHSWQSFHLSSRFFSFLLAYVRCATREQTSNQWSIWLGLCTPIF